MWDINFNTSYIEGANCDNFYSSTGFYYQIYAKGKKVGNADEFFMHNVDAPEKIKKYILSQIPDGATGDDGTKTYVDTDPEQRERIKNAYKVIYILPVQDKNYKTYYYSTLYYFLKRDVYGKDIRDKYVTEFLFNNKGELIDKIETVYEKGQAKFSPNRYLTITGKEVKRKD